jgi:hypothetical protein
LETIAATDPNAEIDHIKNEHEKDHNSSNALILKQEERDE